VVTILRPLSTSELLDRTFHLYRNNFLLFVGIAAIPQLVVFALHMADAALWLRRLIESQILRTWFFVLASFIAIEISHAATVIAVSDLHLSKSASIPKAYSTSAASFLRVIGITLVAFGVPILLGVVVGIIAIAIAAGALAIMGAFSGVGGSVWVRSAIFVVLGFAGPLLAARWWLAWALVTPVTVIEGGGLRTSMRRSSSLTEGRRGRIFVTYVLVLLLTWIVQILFQTPFYAMIRWNHVFRPTHVGTAALVASATGALLSTSLVGPLITIAFTLIYYDERVRREGLDLQLMMSTLEDRLSAGVAALAS